MFQRRTNQFREALNPIAEALAMKRLVSEFRYTHDEIGMLLGVSRSQVTNLLRLLSLDARIQHWMKQGHLSESHGKLLAGLPLDKQYWFAYEAIKQEWPISVLDNAIKASDHKKREASKARKLTSPTLSIERQVTEQFGYPITLTVNKNETGYFRISFHDRVHMQKILEKLGCTSSESCYNNVKDTE